MTGGAYSGIWNTSSSTLALLIAGDTLDPAQVVRDEQHADAVGFLELDQNLKHPDLDRNV